MLALDPCDAPRNRIRRAGKSKTVWQRRQVPRGWIRAYGAPRAYAVWGALLGSGVATIVPHSAYLVLLAAELVSGPKAGALAGAAFGLTRGLMAAALARSRGPSAEIADVLPRPGLSPLAGIWPWRPWAAWPPRAGPAPVRSGQPTAFAATATRRAAPPRSRRGRPSARHSPRSCRRGRGRPRPSSGSAAHSRTQRPPPRTPPRCPRPTDLGTPTRTARSGPFCAACSIINSCTSAGCVSSRRIGTVPAQTTRPDTSRGAQRQRRVLGSHVSHAQITRSGAAQTTTTLTVRR
jgi:hypothetical protein